MVYPKGLIGEYQLLFDFGGATVYQGVGQGGAGGPSNCQDSRDGCTDAPTAVCPPVTNIVRPSMYSTY